ncbi:MAG: hypothetical protein ACKV2V_08875 [Blastocatellia bacterium]
MRESLPAAGRIAGPVATRLLRAVIAKTVLEILALCFLVSLAAYWFFLPRLRGAIDVVKPGRIAGWALDSGRPDERTEVQLFIDDRFVASRRADEKREDLVGAGVAGDAHHGFSFSGELPMLTPGDHLVQVYAVSPSAGGHRTMFPLAETPVRLSIK